MKKMIIVLKEMKVALMIMMMLGAGQCIWRPGQPLDDYDDENDDDGDKNDDDDGVDDDDDDDVQASAYEDLGDLWSEDWVAGKPR